MHGTTVKKKVVFWCIVYLLHDGKVQEKKAVSVCYTPPSKLYSVDLSQFYSSCGNANLRRVTARNTVATARRMHPLQ